MISVVDSSVAVKWYVAEADSDIAEILLQRPLIAPDLIRAEVANALRKKVLRGELEPAQTVAALPHLARSVRLMPSEAFAESALELSLDLVHPVYDCFFLLLAQTLDFPLVTSDRRLWKRTRGTPFAERVVMLSDWEHGDG